MVQKSVWGVQHSSFLWHWFTLSLKTSSIGWMFKGSPMHKVSVTATKVNNLCSDHRLCKMWWQNHFFHIKDASLPFNVMHTQDWYIYTATLHYYCVISSLLLYQKQSLCICMYQCVFYIKKKNKSIRLCFWKHGDYTKTFLPIQKQLDYINRTHITNKSRETCSYKWNYLSTLLKNVFFFAYTPAVKDSDQMLTPTVQWTRHTSLHSPKLINSI